MGEIMRARTKGREKDWKNFWVSSVNWEFSERSDGKHQAIICVILNYLPFRLIKQNALLGNFTLHPRLWSFKWVDLLKFGSKRWACEIFWESRSRPIASKRREDADEAEAVWCTLKWIFFYFRCTRSIHLDNFSRPDVEPWRRCGSQLLGCQSK